MWMPKPQHVVVGAVAAIAFVILALLVANPAGLAPGMAEASVDQDEIVLIFEAGDRYFWLPAEPKDALEVSTFVEELEGTQTVIGRPTFSSTDRKAYDEGSEGPDEFTLVPNQIYQVAGIREDAELRFTAKPGTTGKDFSQEIVDASTSFLRRLGTHIRDLPATVWHELRDIVVESKDLFSKQEVTNEETGETEVRVGAGIKTLQHFEKLLPHAGIIVALFLVGSLLGFDTVTLGAASGVYLIFAGYWPYGLGVAMAGFIFDNNNAGPNVAQRTLGLVADGTSEFGEDFPRVVGAMVFYLTGFVVGLVGIFLDRPGIAVVALAVGSALGTVVIFDGARSSSRAIRIRNLAKTSPYDVRRVELSDGRTILVRRTVSAWKPHIPAYVITAMGIGDALAFAWWGYASYAFWTLTATAIFLALYFHWFWNARKFEERGQKYDPVNIRSSVHHRRVKAWQEMSAWSKAGIWVTLVSTYLMVGALTNRDFLAAASYLVMVLPLWIWMLFLVPSRIRDYVQDKIPDETKEKYRGYREAAQSVFNPSDEGET